MVSGFQCINPDCLNFTLEAEECCPLCGSILIVDERFRPYKILHNVQKPWSHKESQTFEAIHLKSGYRVVLRVVNSTDPKITTSLVEAVYALRQVHGLSVHQGIMRLIQDKAYFTWKILPDGPAASCMVTELVEGVPLDEWIENKGPIDQTLAIDWLKQLVDAANALHEEGFVHRDIKPANIIVKDDTQLVLVDLGAICFVDPVESLNRNISRGDETYPVIGSPRFMPPEQSEGKPLPVSDYYAIGQTIINLVTGIHPTDLPRIGSQPDRLDWREQASQISEKFADYLDLLVHPNYHFRPSNPERIVQYVSDPSVFNDSHASEHPSSRFTLKPKHLRVIRLLALAFFLTISIKAGAVYQARSEIYSVLEESNQLLEIGDSLTAIRILESAVREYPRSAVLRLNLGLAYFNIGNQEKAVENLEFALQIDESPIYYYNLGNILERSDLPLAIQNYQAAIASADDDSAIKSFAQNNIARLYLLNGQLEEAELLLNSIELDQIESPVSRAIVLKNRGWLLREQGKLDQALDALNQSIETDPTRPDAYCLMALITGNEDDRITCLSLYNPVDKPEIRLWKSELLITD